MAFVDCCSGHSYGILAVVPFCVHRWDCMKNICVCVQCFADRWSYSVRFSIDRNVRSCIVAPLDVPSLIRDRLVNVQLDKIGLLWMIWRIEDEFYIDLCRQDFIFNCGSFDC